MMRSYIQYVIASVSALCGLKLDDDKLFRLTSLCVYTDFKSSSGTLNLKH